MQEREGVRRGSKEINTYIAGMGETADEILLIHPVLQIADPERADLVGARKLGILVLRLRRGGRLRRWLLVVVHGRLWLILERLLLLTGNHPWLLLLLLVLEVVLLVIAGHGRRSHTCCRLHHR